MKQAWTVKEVAGLLSSSLEATQALARAVFEGPRDLFSYQDLTLLRAARGIEPANRSKEAVGRVRRELGDLPMASVSMQKVGRETVVNSGASRFNASSGQLLMDFKVPEARGAVWLRPLKVRDADALFAAAVALEEGDAEEAINAYAEALAADPHHADAHVNLGRLLHQAKRFREAEAHYIAALVARPTDVTATFNLGVVLEDLGRIDEALMRYRETIELDPLHVDAYFNCSRLFELKGEKIAALRHLKDYRRLTR